MFATKKTFAATIALLAAVTTDLSAQTLDADVVRNPDDTVTYTINLDGPPRGNFMLFVSPFAMVYPIQLPGIGNIHLDPRATFPVAPALPLDTNGRGRLSLRVPVGAIHDLPMHFQAVVIDPLRQVRTTDFLSTWYKDDGRNFVGDSRFNVKSQPGKRLITGTVKGDAGKPVEIQIEGRNGVMRTLTGRIGVNGELAFGWGYRGYDIQHGDRVLFHYDGKPVGMIQY